MAASTLVEPGSRDEPMGWSREQLYARILERDPTFNGRFLVCVRSTGIYCLPSCKAKKPLLQNVSFCATEPARARGR